MCHPVHDSSPVTILVHGGAGNVDESTWDHKYNASKAAVRAVYDDLVSGSDGLHNLKKFLVSLLSKL